MSDEDLERRLLRWTAAWMASLPNWERVAAGGRSGVAEAARQLLTEAREGWPTGLAQRLGAGAAEGTLPALEVPELAAGPDEEAWLRPALWLALLVDRLPRIEAEAPASAPELRALAARLRAAESARAAAWAAQLGRLARQGETDRITRATKELSAALERNLRR